MEAASDKLDARLDTSIALADLSTAASQSYVIG
jgi:hypothetical protein